MSGVAERETVWHSICTYITGCAPGGRFVELSWGASRPYIRLLTSSDSSAAVPP